MQINTWNEWRKDRLKEKTVIEDLASSIEINIETFQRDIEQLQLWTSRAISFCLPSRKGFHIQIARITKQSLFLSNVGYQADKDQGLDITTKKALSVEIVKLCEATIPGILATNDLRNEILPEWDNYLVLNFNFVA